MPGVVMGGRGMWSLWPLWYTHFTQGLHTTLPYVLSVYMVRAFLLDQGGVDGGADETAVGFKVGILGAAFCFSQTFTSYPLGLLSDRVGRKPILVLGNVSCAVGVVAFGLSGDFAQALVTRLAMGATNGIIGAEKAYIGDNLSREEQAEAMGLISLTWGIGSLVGPLLGGLLSNPCDLVTIPGVCGAGGLFVTRPFSLPCIFASLISVMAVISTLCFLKEDPRRLDPVVSDGSEVDEESKPLRGVVERDRRREALYKKNSDLEQEIELGCSLDGRNVGRQLDECLERSTVQGTVGNNNANTPWYRQKNVILSLIGYTGVAFAYICVDELVPLFASAAIVDGGLSYSTQMLSGPLAFSGIALIAWMMGGYKWLQNKIGTKPTCIIGLWMTIPIVMLFPLSSVLGRPFSGILFWMAMGLKSVSGSNAFTSCLVLVNLAAPKESLGQVNGLGQTLASFVRALGPWLGGILWSASLIAFESVFGSSYGHQWVPFLLPVLLSGACIYVYKHLDILE
jgi:fucose permease